ncbi:unnamed protein product [Penicillium pancosmium]
MAKKKTKQRNSNEVPRPPLTPEISPKVDYHLLVCFIIPVREGDFLGVFSESGGSTKVRIQWDLIHDDVDTDNCTPWRVSVKATKPMLPFESLVREAAQQEQYVLHLSPEHAKRGFLEFCETD